MSTYEVRVRPRLVLAAAALCVAGLVSVVTDAPGYAAGPSRDAASVGHGGYEATIVRTAYGIPHITAADFGSLGYGYGYTFASDDLCTMADDYVTVEAQRSRYFGPDGTYEQVGPPPVNNLDSDLYWRSVAGSGAVNRLLGQTSGPGAVLPQVRRMMAGYVAGYNGYLAAIGGSKGVPDPACRGKAWVRPITLFDAYLRVYQLADILGGAGDPGSLAEAQPPSAGSGAASAGSGVAARVSAAGLAAALARRNGEAGSNAVAVGSAGTRDHGAGILLGNPHFPWDGPERFYESQETIPGVLNVEGASLYGVPLIVIGYNSSVAWSHTDTTSFPFTLYQLTLVPGHPTEYLLDGKAVAMTRQTVTVPELGSSGRLTPVTRTLWSTRWGSVIDEIQGDPLPWTSTTAYVLADAGTSDFRLLNDFFTTDRATSTAQILAGQQKYEGMPWVDTVATDTRGHALYTDIGNFAHVTDALAARCDTPLGARLFEDDGLPILDGSRAACAWGTDPDSAAPGIFGAHEEPVIARSDYVENSNMSYWLTNASAPVTGFPRILGLTDIPATLRTRSGLTMVSQRIAGTDGLGPAGFTLRDMQNLMYSDIEFGASLVKPELVSMCESLPGGTAPTSSGGTAAVGDACQVLAAWNGREDPDSHGAVLFRDFWERALALPEGPWSTPFDDAHPVTTPSGLNTSDKAVIDSFGDALADLAAARLPNGVALGALQFVVRNGVHIPIPGGPGDPDGDFNAIYQNVLTRPGVDPDIGSSYIQAVTWDGNGCPVARTVLTYSESDNSVSPHYADQTGLFSHRQWVDNAFCSADVRGQAVSAVTVSGH